MRGYGRRLVLPLTIIPLWASATPLSAQTSDGNEEEASAGERETCVWVDPEEVRQRVRQEMERVRDELGQARRRVEEVRRRLGSRARLGVGIDYEQPPRWDSVGVRVTEVPADGPAAEAGIREGDVIVSLDGRSLTSPLRDPEDEDDLDGDRSLPAQRLVLLVRKHEPGDEVEVGYLRDGERAVVSAELSAAPHLPVPPRPFRFRDDPARIHGPLPAPGRDLEQRLRRELRRSVGPLRWSESCRNLRADVPRPMAAPCVAGLGVAGLNPGLGEYFGAEGASGR